MHIKSSNIFSGKEVAFTTKKTTQMNRFSILWIHYSVVSLWHVHSRPKGILITFWNRLLEMMANGSALLTLVVILAPYFSAVVNALFPPNNSVTLVFCYPTITESLRLSGISGDHLGKPPWSEQGHLEPALQGLAVLPFTHYCLIFLVRMLWRMIWKTLLRSKQSA